MKTAPNPFHPPPEWTDRERELDALEPAWADAAHALRGGGPSRQTRRDVLMGMVTSLPDLHIILDRFKDEFDRGAAWALYDALRICLEENLPIPYWAAGGLLRVMDQVDKQPGLSLHQALALHARYPLTKKKANSSRVKWKRSVELWQLIKVNPHLKQGVAPAIDAVRKANPGLAAFFCPRAAYDAYLRVERIQTRGLISKRALHRI